MANTILLILISISKMVFMPLSLAQYECEESVFQNTDLSLNLLCRAFEHIQPFTDETTQTENRDTKCPSALQSSPAFITLLAVSLLVRVRLNQGDRDYRHRYIKVLN